MTDHPNQSRYTKINVTQLAKIVDDMTMSLQMLQRLGFIASKNSPNQFIFTSMPDESIFEHQNPDIRRLYNATSTAFQLSQTHSYVILMNSISEFANYTN